MRSSDVFAVLGRAGRAHLPRRQSAHQGVPVLGVGDRRRARRDYPDAIFLAEAFTRPRVMHRLAKLGFTQSYTYFTWRNTKAELTEYFTELTHDRGREYFRPNLWPNTPDILPEVSRSAAGPRSPAGWCWRRRSARTTASMGRRSSWERTLRYQRGQRGVSQLGEVRDQALEPRGAREPARADHPGQSTRGATTRRCSATTRFAFIDSTTRYSSATASRTADCPTSWWRWSASTRSPPRRGWIQLDLDRLGIAADQALRGATTS